MLHSQGELAANAKQEQQEYLDGSGSGDAGTLGCWLEVLLNNTCVCDW